MVQRPIISLGSPGRIVEIEPSLEDMILLLRIPQDRARKYNLDQTPHLPLPWKVLAGIDIPRLASLFFLPLEA